MDRDAQLEVVDNIWPAITAADVAMLATQLDPAQFPSGAGGPADGTKVLHHSWRPMSSAALAELPNGHRVFIKRFSSLLTSPAELEAKHSFVNQLADLGFPTPRFLQMQDGATVLAAGNLADAAAGAADADTSGSSVPGLAAAWLYEVSELATGEDRYRATTSWEPPATLGETTEMGRLAGQLRLASEQLNAAIAPAAPAPAPYQNRVDLMLGDPITKIDDWLSKRTSVVEYLKATSRNIKRDLEVPAQFSAQLTELEAVPRHWTHGDLHVSNTFWDGERITSLIDFGLAYVNPSLFDLATLIERHAIDWLAITEGKVDAWRPEVAACLLAGYRESYPLSAAEGKLLAPLIAVSQSEFELDCISYDQLTPQPGRIADWSYDVAFIGHNRWFTTTPGEEFLATITELATK